MLAGRRTHAFFDAPFLAFAHRGGAVTGEDFTRENTVHAFDQAVARGYRYLETDVHASRDGVLFAFHDERLDRVTDRSGLIADLTASEVREARIAGTDPIPTLDMLLDRYPEQRFNIDAKAPAAVDLLVRAIEEHRAHDRVHVSSFSTQSLHRLRAALGDRVPSSTSLRGIGWTRFVPVLPRWFMPGGDSFQLPIRHPVLGRPTTILTDRLIEHVHRAGRQVHVWTIDDAATMNRLIDRGVDGIFTDRIDTLKEVLVQRGLWT